MFKISWDSQTGGVILSSRVTKETLGIAPRPVFFEELDLLGLEELGWRYPRAEAPIMWAVNKQYWYRGEMLFEVKGANIYDAPTVVLAKGVEPMELQAVDVEAMIAKNADPMFLIESEAIEFIRDTFVAYSDVNRARGVSKANSEIDYEAMAARVEKKTKTKMAVVKRDCDSFDIVPLDVANREGKRVVLSTKIDRFIASFSGGKDSQVVLDLCTRAIPPTAFEVIYSDTGYELPPSLALYEEVQRYYGEKFPSLKFTTTRNHESVLNYWDKIGTPSDTHRWCCSVMKTAPLYRSLKVDGNKQARVLAFEGVRAEESTRRSAYCRIGKGVKHSYVINARPILGWNSTEVYLYLFIHKLPINKAYRIGKPRVGCIFCPYGSPWDDMIVSKAYPQELKPFLSVIEKNVKDRKIPNAKEYIVERRWKLRSSGTNTGNKTLVKIKNSSNSIYEVEIKNPQNSILIWLPTIGSIIYRKSESLITGILEFEKQRFSFSILEKKDLTVFKVEDWGNVSLRYYLRRIIYKSSYCINCEACEIECPTGALRVYPKVTIDESKCIHCLKCIDYHQHGCIVADSLVTTMGNLNNTTKISAYGTFGIQEAWVDEFLTDPTSFWEANSLGVKQEQSFRAWLRDAELLDSKKQATPLAHLFSEIKDDYYNTIWEVIYVNLCYNNSLMQWFSQEVQFGKVISRKEIEVMIQEYFNGTFAKSSITYALQALLQVFKYSPIGTTMEQLVPEDSRATAYVRMPYDDVSDEGVAYSILKYTQHLNVDMCRVSDFYKVDVAHGIYKEFGMHKPELQKILRTLTALSNSPILAELNMGLDHISIKKSITPVELLRQLTM